jgi:hypothetical protein
VTLPSDLGAPPPGDGGDLDDDRHESVENSAARADATGGPDIAAIIAAAESARHRDSDHYEED